MALPTSSISTTMVSQAIGLASNDVGTLCSSSKVNKWSRYKPVNGDYYHPTCGFLIGSTTDQRPDILRSDAWVYDFPKGGANSPYRLGDFRRYDHSVTFVPSTPTFGINVNYPTGSVDGNGNVIGTMYISCNFGQNVDNTLASPRYMDQFANYYFGISVYKGNQVNFMDHVISKCGTSQIGLGSGELIQIDTTGLEFKLGQVYMVIPFVSQYAFTTSTGPTGGAGNYLKYSLNALYADSATIRRNIGTPNNNYYFDNYITQQLGSYGLRVSCTANSNRDVALSPAPFRIEWITYSDPNGSGTIIDSISPTILGYYSFLPFGSVQLPSTDIGWQVSGSVKSVKVKYTGGGEPGDFVIFNIT